MLPVGYWSMFAPFFWIKCISSQYCSKLNLRGKHFCDLRVRENIFTVLIIYLDTGLNWRLIIVWAINPGSNILTAGNGLAAFSVHLQQLAKVKTGLLQNLDLQ